MYSYITVVVGSHCLMAGKSYLTVQSLVKIKMESYNEEAHISDLSDEEIKSRIIEEMQNYTFICEKSDPEHAD